MRYTTILFALMTGVLLTQGQYTASFIALFFTLVVSYSGDTESEDSHV